MKKTGILALCLAATTAFGDIRGVPTSMKPLYEGSTFECLDKSKVIDISRVNDDYCDCPDGSDEPGTSACVNGTFYCKNRGARGKYIASMYVNDGIVDCCDCSDEYEKRTPAAKACVDTCAQEGHEMREKQSELIRIATEGAKLRAQYSKAGLEYLESKYSATSELTSQKIALENQISELSSRIAALEEVVKPLEDLSNSANVKDLARGLGLEHLSKDDLVRIIAQFIEKEETDMLAYLYQLAQSNKLSPNLPNTFVPSLAPSSESAASPAATLLTLQKELERLQNSLSSVENKIDHENQKVSEDFGPGASFFKLKDQCYTYQTHQYKYSVCPFRKATQESTNLGHYTGWGKKDNGEVDYQTMLFQNGMSCWNGPSRSLSLTFECGIENKILSIDEPSMCVYTAKFSTPAVCDDRLVKELRLQLDPDEF